MVDIQFRITQDITNKQALVHPWDTGDVQVVCSWCVQQTYKFGTYVFFTIDNGTFD